jgi:hypothetical protein
MTSGQLNELRGGSSSLNARMSRSLAQAFAQESGVWRRRIQNWRTARLEL